LVAKLSITDQSFPIKDIAEKGTEPLKRIIEPCFSKENKCLINLKLADCETKFRMPR